MAEGTPSDYQSTIQDHKHESLAAPKLGDLVWKAGDRLGGLLDEGLYVLAELEDRRTSEPVPLFFSPVVHRDHRIPVLPR